MIIIYATVTGVNETTSVSNLVSLMNAYQFGEIGIEVSESLSYSGERLRWIDDLSYLLKERSVFVNAALHVGGNWLNDLYCGIVAPELKQLLNLRNIYRTPLFRRLQLGFGPETNNVPEDCGDALLSLQQKWRCRFVIPFHGNNYDTLQKLRDKGVAFDTLFEEKSMENCPFFPDSVQGYTGKFSHLNVAGFLDKVSIPAARSSTTCFISVDAKEGLKSNGQLSMDKCHKYLLTVKTWYEHYKWQSVDI